MTENPYSSSIDSAGLPTSRAPKLSRVTLAILKYLGSYLLGIFACVILTPVQPQLAGVVLWPYFPLFAVLGVFLFYLHLSGAYLPFGGTGVAYWSMFLLGFAPVVFEAIVYRLPSSRLRHWRPLWIGFPVGFVGTLGVYFTAAGSI